MLDSPDLTANPHGFSWDTNTAAAVIVLGALVLLFVINRGFRGVVVDLGS